MSSITNLCAEISDEAETKQETDDGTKLTEERM